MAYIDRVMKLHLLPAGEADLPYIVEVYNSVVPSGIVTADAHPVTEESRRTWLREHHHPERPVWILTADREPCGWMSFSDYYDRPAYDITAEVSIYLEERFRGRSLGKRFLRLGLDRMKATSLRNVVAFVFTVNTVSMRLFESAGFSNWGLMPATCLLHGTELDVAILGLRL